MSISAQSNPDSSKWQDLDQVQIKNHSSLEEIQEQLDLVLLALEAIANVNYEAIFSAAKELNLESMIGDRLNILAQSYDPKKELNLDTARSLVLIICHLAQQHQELLRRAVSLLEQTIQQQQVPEETSLLGNYLEGFIQNYRVKINPASDLTSENLAQIAWQLLIALLFYSGTKGHLLLWLAVIK